MAASIAVWNDVLDSLSVIPARKCHLFAASARRRLPADPDNRPYVALAMRMECGLLTKNVTHFSASGVPIWNSATVRLLLDE